MPKTHYEILGIKKSATTDEIRAAYRGLVMKHHPDRSKDPKSTDIFIQVTSAYEVLSDSGRRSNYDAVLSMEAERARQAAQDQQVRSAQYGGGTSPGYPPPKKQSPSSVVTVEVTKLTMMFSRGQFGDAERLAHRILAIDNRQPIPYAVLGDIARARGQTTEAAKMYSMAVQMDPTNAIYQKRYSEVVRSDGMVPITKSMLTDQGNTQLFAPLVGAAIVLLGCFYLALSRELPFVREFPPISTWTLGLVVVLLLGGVAIGASMASGGLLERLQTLTTATIGRPSPTMTLGMIAIVNFWAAAAFFGLVGLSQKSFNLTTTRLVLSAGAATVLLAASAAAGGTMDGIQVLLWGGNLVYLGSLVGWTVADSFRW